MSFKVAIVGTGSIGFRHLSVLHNAGHAVIAVPKRPDRAAELRTQGFAVAMTLEEAAGDGATCAIVASDTRLHAEDTIAALSRGLSVLVEKPLTPDAADAEKIRSAAQASRRNVYVGCTLRFSESLQRFKEWLPRIGAIHSVRIACQSYLPDWRPARPFRDSYSARANEGGVLRDLIHEIDYAGWLFGWPERIQATLKNFGRLSIESEELADLRWSAPQGAAVSICLDYISHPPCRKMRARGENGTLEWDGIGQQVRFQTGTSGDEFVSTQSRNAMVLAQDLAFASPAHSAPLVSLEEGIHAVAICDAARLSSASRCEETVRSFDS